MRDRLQSISKFLDIDHFTLIEMLSAISRNWRYKDVYRETIECRHNIFILEAIYILCVCNVHFKLAFSTEYKNSVIIDSALSLYTKI